MPRPLEDMVMIFQLGQVISLWWEPDAKKYHILSGPAYGTLNEYGKAHANQVVCLVMAEIGISSEELSEEEDGRIFDVPRAILSVFDN